jgi:acyl carrier protein
MKSVEEVVARTLRVPLEKISDETSSTNLKKWDSFAHMNLMVALETAFGVTFTTTEIVALRSVASVKAALRGKGVAL